MSSVNRLSCLILLLTLFGCGEMTDDLLPSGKDMRVTALANSIGPSVGQKAPDFSLLSTDGTAVSLTNALASRKGIVLYFTMWCPACDVHMTHIIGSTMPQFPLVGFYAVDYVSGSLQEAKDAELSNGFSGSGMTVLADIDRAVLSGYTATMSTAVVIDAQGVVRMNEDYKDGTRLSAVLSGLP